MSDEQTERLIKALEALVARLQAGPLFVIAEQPSPLRWELPSAVPPWPLPNH